MFATEDVTAGTLVLNEHPLLPVGVRGLQNHHLEAVFDAFDKLSGSSKEDQYLNLFHRADGATVDKCCKSFDLSADQWEQLDHTSQVVLLIFYINAYNIDEHGYAKAVYDVGSRFNHSCDPNVEFSSRPYGYGEWRVLPGKAVRRGEELTISYVPASTLALPRRRRMRRLMRWWRFWCECSRCTAEEDEDEVAAPRLGPWDELMERIRAGAVIYHHVEE